MEAIGYEQLMILITQPKVGGPQSKLQHCQIARGYSRYSIASWCDFELIKSDRCSRLPAIGDYLHLSARVLQILHVTEVSAVLSSAGS